MMKQKFIVDINPSTGEMLEKIKCSSPGEISSCIKLSRKAFKYWSEISLNFRIKHFSKIVREIKQEMKNLSEIISLEMGKPVAESEKEVLEIIENINLLCNLSVEAFSDELFKEKNLRTKVKRIPLGIVAVIPHWCYPALIPAKIIINAILAGNTAIFKPSEVTPLTGRMLYEIFNKHLPKGVLNIIQGSYEVTECLLSSDINMVSFVGTRTGGKQILNLCYGKLHKVLMELAGKDAMIVLSDANILESAKFAVKNSLFNCGQDYNSIERIFVESAVEKKFIEVVLKIIQDYDIGDALQGAKLGPMATDYQRNHVFSQIEQARRKGAIILHGGSKPFRKGFFLEPTVIADVNEKHNLMKEETFGPVIAISKVSSYSEAVIKNNKLPYGLGVSVWTNKLSTGEKICNKLDSGLISINKSVTGIKGTPFIGIKDSGYGYAGCYEPTRFYTNPKKITY